MSLSTVHKREREIAVRLLVGRINYGPWITYLDNEISNIWLQGREREREPRGSDVLREGVVPCGVRLGCTRESRKWVELRAQQDALGI